VLGFLFTNHQDKWVSWFRPCWTNSTSILIPMYATLNLQFFFRLELHFKSPTWWNAFAILTIASKFNLVWSWYDQYLIYMSCCLIAICRDMMQCKEDRLFSNILKISPALGLHQVISMPTNQSQICDY
jgi:hypothetical protein